MLDMGFNDDIMKIISFLPKNRQTLLFSATMPGKIRELAKKILKNPEEINISLSKPPEKIRQEAFVVFDHQKPSLIKYLLKLDNYQSVLIFCSKKHTVKDLTFQLKRAGFSADEIHSDLEQSKREEVLASFINKRLRILVATDILSRGIHIDNIELVLNYDVPNDGEDYVHRIGRTARAETNGVAFTLINEKEQRKFYAIESLIGKTVNKANVPSEFGETPMYSPQEFHSRKPKKKFYKKDKRA
jgi:superfamily II DNA/RNA helicase